MQGVWCKVSLKNVKRLQALPWPLLPVPTAWRHSPFKEPCSVHRVLASDLYTYSEVHLPVSDYAWGAPEVCSSRSHWKKYPPPPLPHPFLPQMELNVSCLPATVYSILNPFSSSRVKIWSPSVRRGYLPLPLFLLPLWLLTKFICLPVYLTHAHMTAS